MLALKLAAPSSNSEIMELAAQNPGYRFEREPDGTLTVAPTRSESGRRNAALGAALSNWNATRAMPGICFDSSTGFTLPDGSLVSPDGAWIERERWLKLSEAEREDYAPLVPDVVVEIISKSDRPASVKAKLQRCRRLGASYVVMLDPYRREAWSDGIAPEGLELSVDAIAPI